MTTRVIFTSFARSAFGAAALFVLPVAAFAGGDSDDIVVRSATAMQQWQDKTTSELDRALMREPPGATTENAIVQIAFTLGADGKAENLQFYNRDGSSLERMMAKRAINSLDSLADVPVTKPEEAQFLASIIFANDARNYARLQRRLEKMETARLASEGSRPRYLALGY
jgi:hypothetical protein